MTISNDKTVPQLYLIRIAHSPCKINHLEYGVIQAAAILYGNTQLIKTSSNFFASRQRSFDNKAFLLEHCDISLYRKVNWTLAAGD